MNRELGALAGGIAMIAFAVCVVIFVAGRADVGGNDPFERDEVADYLGDIEEGKDATRLAFGFGVVIDAGLVLVLAATTYSLFRDRSHWLAALAMAGFVANAAVSGVTDGVGVITTFVADDFVNGGSGLAPGDPSVFETGRVLGMMLVTLTQIQVTAFGTAELAFGALLGFSPAGHLNPPRVLGWLAMASGAAGIVGWGVFAAEFFLVFLIISTVGTLVLLLWLGAWLILNRRTTEFPAVA
jgi:hypothetical protein